MDQGISNFRSFQHVFKRTVSIRLHRVKIDYKEIDENIRASNIQSTNFRITRSKKAAANVEWVRITNGIYKGDIAKVESIDNAKGEVNLRILSRINYDDVNQATKNIVKRRPPQMPLNVNLLR